MRIPMLCCLAAAALLAGCTETRQGAGAPAANDHNVLTGGPTAGTTVADLPSAVRATLQQRVPHAEIADIDKTTRNGQVVYEISFIQSGKNPKLHITEDGTVLSSSGQQYR